MALSRTQQDTEADQTASGGPPTGVSTAFTPPNNSLLVVIAALQGNNSTPGTMSISGGGLTWTARAGPSTPGTLGDYYGRTACWTAPVGTGASMQVTVTTSENAVGDAGNVLLDIEAFEGYDTDAPIGATASSTTTDEDGLTLTLSGAPSTNSIVIAWRARGDQGGVASTATPGPGWTEVSDQQSVSAGYTDLQVMVRTGSASTSVTWDDVCDAVTNSFYTHAFALEIKASSGTQTLMGQAIF